MSQAAHLTRRRYLDLMFLHGFGDHTGLHHRYAAELGGAVASFALQVTA